MNPHDQKEPAFRIIPITVDPEGNVVKFMLRQGVFTAYRDKAFHIHHRRNPYHPAPASDTTIDIEMTASLVCAPESNMAVLFCQACGLRIRMDAFSKNEQGLHELFLKRTSQQTDIL